MILTEEVNVLEFILVFQTGLEKRLLADGSFLNLLLANKNHCLQYGCFSADNLLERVQEEQKQGRSSSCPCLHLCSVTSKLPSVIFVLLVYSDSVLSSSSPLFKCCCPWEPLGSSLTLFFLLVNLTSFRLWRTAYFDGYTWQEISIKINHKVLNILFVLLALTVNETRLIITLAISV